MAIAGVDKAEFGAQQRTSFCASVTSATAYPAGGCMGTPCARQRACSSVRFGYMGL